MVTVVNKNIVYIKGLPPSDYRAIKQDLMIDDPTYHKMVAMGTPVWGKDRYFRYYKEFKGDILGVPKGYANKVIEYLKKNGVRYEVRRERLDIKREDAIISSIDLRDYQIPIVDTIIEKKEGVVHMSTGSGKSVVALEACARLGRKATIIVKDKTLLHQMIGDAKKFLNYDCGQIGDGKKEIKDITIATVQTLDSDKELCKELAEQTSVLFVDEIQEFVTYKRKEVIDTFAPEYFIGLTATPYRSKDDGRTDAIGFIFGDVIAKHIVKQMAPTVHVYFTGAKIPVRAKYSDMVEDMINDELRNQLIGGIASGEAFEGKKVLILTKRILHAEAIYDIIKSVGGTYLIKSDTKNKAELLKEFKSGERDFTCLIGTMSLLGTGFDVPTLDRLIIAGDLKSNVLTVQSIGRILRLLNDKDPIVYDMCDEKNPMLMAQFNSRYKVYRTNEWNVEWHPEHMYWKLKKWNKIKNYG